MAEHNAERSVETSSRTRRQILTLLSAAVCGALAMATVGCAQEQTQGWERPDWFRAKRGSNGNGRGRS